MEMINRLTADALDSKSFVNRIKAMEDDRRMEMEKALTENDVTGTVCGGVENRQQRRARERAQRKAASKANR